MTWGLGKTIQTLALIQRDWHIRRAASGSSDLSHLGRQQLAKGGRLASPRIFLSWFTMASKETKGEEFKKEAARQAIVISSYALLHRDFETFKEVDWAGVVLDEAQNIKNPETKQAKAARALKADYRIALTGTPVENNVGDLWSIMEFLNPGFLGTQAEFKETILHPHPGRPGSLRPRKG